MIHLHGTPITPRSVLYELAGRSFCVSYAAPDQVETCHLIGESVMLDNGAFSAWRRGYVPDWDAYMDWCEPWLEYPTTWAVIPDVIGGSEEENDLLLAKWIQRQVPKGAPVWHLHESLDRLTRLAVTFDRICFGSSGEYATLGSPAWHRRTEQAFNALCGNGPVPVWVHMLRGLDFCGSDYPFASADSTNIAQNHSRNRKLGKGAARMADEIDARQCPAQWRVRESHPELWEQVA